MQGEIYSPPANHQDQDRGWGLLAVCMSFMTCAVVSTCLRVFVRARLTRNLGWDDYNMIAATVTTVVGGGLVVAEVVSGLGRHEYYLTATQRRHFVKFGWLDWMQTFLTLMFTKISICLLLLRIMVQKWFVRSIYTLIICLVIFHMVCFFLFLGVCRPLNAYWTAGLEGKCLSENQVEYIIIAQGVFSIITDLICATFPIIILRQVQMNFRTKLMLCILMGLGVITAICCTIRTVLSGSLVAKDLSWEVVSNVYWRLPEVNIGIVCANAPLLRPLYLFLSGRLHRPQPPTSSNDKDRIWPVNGLAKPSQSQGIANNVSSNRNKYEGDLMSQAMDLPIQNLSRKSDIDEEGYVTYLSLVSGGSVRSGDEGRGGVGEV